MRVLTLSQPWASLVAVGAKRIETRSWTTGYRGPLAIQAGVGLPKGGVRGLVARCMEPQFTDALGHLFPDDVQELAAEHVAVLPRGAIVAVCEVRDVIPVEEVWFEAHAGWAGPAPARTRRYPRTWLAEYREQRFGDYTEGRYAWLLKGVQALTFPVPYLNGQGLRHLDEKQLTLRELERRRKLSVLSSMGGGTVDLSR